MTSRSTSDDASSAALFPGGVRTRGCSRPFSAVRPMCRFINGTVFGRNANPSLTIEGKCPRSWQKPRP